MSTFLPALLGNQPADILTRAVVGTPLEKTLTTRALVSWISVVGATYDGCLPGTDLLVKFEREGLVYRGAIGDQPFTDLTTPRLLKHLADVLMVDDELPPEEGDVAKFCRSLDGMVRAAWTLEKTSKNVKQKRAEITRAQADQRRERYARSLGLEPTKIATRNQQVVGKEAGIRQGNEVAYGGQFLLPHEVGHAMFTDRGKTARSHQRDLDRVGAIPDYEDNTINTSLEYKLDRRAGVDPHKFNEARSGGRGSFMESFRGTIGDDEGLPVRWNAGKPDPEDLRMHHERDQTARAVVGRFDAGRRFDEKGRVRSPNTLDARISMRGRKDQGFSGAPRPAGAARIPPEKQLAFPNFDFRPAPQTAEKTEMAPTFVAPRKADQPTPPVGPKQPRQPRAPKPPGDDDVR